MDWRSLILLALFAWAWEARAAAPDPVTSVMWDYYHQRLLNGEAFVFDDKIRLEVPPFAEDARQVPIQRILWPDETDKPRVPPMQPVEKRSRRGAVGTTLAQYKRSPSTCVRVALNVAVIVPSHR